VDGEVGWAWNWEVCGGDPRREMMRRKDATRITTHYDDR
jgi:hypothetical protein